MKAEVNATFFFETIYKFETQSEAQRHPHYGRFLNFGGFVTRQPQYFVSFT